MMQLDGLACATVELWDQATATAPTGDLVIAALGGQHPGLDTVLTGTVVQRRLVRLVPDRPARYGGALP